MHTFNQYTLKILVIGDESVGKTSLIHRYKYQKVDEDDLGVFPTKSVNYYVDGYRYSDAEIKVQLWDFPGKRDEMLRRIREDFYNHTNAIILVFDLTRIATLDRLKKIVAEEREFMPACPILVVGTKSDLHDQRDVTPTEASSFVAGLNNAYYMEATFKDYYKAKLVFDRAMRLAFQNKCPEENRFGDEQEWSVAVDTTKNKPDPHELVETFYSDEYNSSADEKGTSNPALIKLRNYAEVLTMLNQMGWKKNDLPKGLEKGDFLWNHVLRDGRAPSRNEIEEILTQNTEQLLDNRSKWPFKLYKIRSFFTGHRNPCQDDRLCESKTEELLVDYFKCL